jgi:DNA polymerase III delta subunit
MVKKESSVYLLIGEDNLSKDIQINRLRQEFLTKELEQFNLDILYARDLNLIDLQKALSCLPIKAKKRIIVVKDAQNLKEEIQDFLLQYAQKPPNQTILVLDINRKILKEDNQFVERISKFACVSGFKEPVRVDTFTLSRQIDLHRPDYALRLLNQLLKNGEKPERILGGLRYACERDITNPLKTRKRIKLILGCDIEIKTGRLKPVFALEKLVVKLCGLQESFS